MGILSYVFGKSVAGFARDAHELVKEERNMRNEQMLKQQADFQDKMSIEKFLSSINQPTYDDNYSCDVDNWSFINDMIDKAPNADALQLYVDIRDTFLMLCKDWDFQLYCHLIRDLFRSIYEFDQFDYDTNIDRTPCLIEHCRKIISELLINGDFHGRSIAIKQLLYAIDAELLMYQGDYVYAISRYFTILTWSDLVENIYEDELIGFNGTEDFYTAVVSNLINLFALLKMPHETDRIRSVFNRIINYTRRTNQNLLTIDSMDTPDNIKKYIYNVLNALNSSCLPVGFYTMDLSREIFDVVSSNYEVFYFPDYMYFEESVLCSDGFCYKKFVAPIGTDQMNRQRELARELWRDL